MMLLRQKRAWLGIGVSILFLALFLWRADLPAAGRALVGANYLWLPPALVVLFLGVWFRSLRWAYLVRPLGPLSAPSAFLLVIIGNMVNNILPVRTGDLVRAYLVGERHRLSKAGALTTVVTERAFDGVVLVLFLALVGAFLGINELFRSLMIGAAAIFLAALGLLYLAAAWRGLAQRLLQGLLGLLPGPIRGRAQGLAEAFLKGLGALRSPRLGALVFLTTALSWSLEATSYYLVGIAFGLGVAFPVYLLVAAAANLALSVPSSQGGIGPFEFFAREALVLAGVGSGAATAYALALHAFTILPLTALGLYCVGALGLSLGEALRPRPPIPQAASLPLEGKGEG